MVTLTLVGDPDENDGNPSAYEMLELARVLKERFPASTRTVEILVENYTDCLRSLLDDYSGLGDAS